MAKRCLITGASGFVGSNVLVYLLNNTDWEFTAICSWRHHGEPENVPRNRRVKVITHDLTAPIPEMGNFDYVFNLASESHVDRSITDPVPFIENNVSSTLNLLEYFRKHRPKMFIHFSTDEVYGATDHENWDVLLPSNPYAASKAAQEMIAIAYWRTYNLPLIITNSNNIIGPNQNPEKFVPKVIELINLGETVRIHATDGIPGRRYWNPVDNVSSALLFLSGFDPKLARYSKYPDRFALGGGTELDNLSMAGLIASLLGKPLSYELVDARLSRPGYDDFYASGECELERFGWKPPITDLAQGLQWIE